MGRMVSTATCAFALLSASASCRPLPESAAPAVPNFAVPASAVARAAVIDLGVGCWIDAPKATDRRNWAPDGRSVAEVLGDTSAPPTPRLALGDGRELEVWQDGSAEWGWRLLAIVRGRDGVAMGSPATVSTSIVGRPLTANEPGHVGLVFLEDADYGLREVHAPVRCTP